MRSRRRPRHRASLAAAALLAALAAGRAGAGDAPAPEEWERPYDGFVPGTPDEPKFSGWTRVIDAATGEPIAGAQLVRWAEFIGEGDLERSWPIGTGTADASGLAHVGPSDATADGHWTASAPGYATACEFGARPPPVMALVRGEAAVLRLLDALGNPVEGARVEWFDGCSHAPTLRAARTDPQGYARFADVDPSQGRLWFASGHGALAPVDARDVFCVGDAVPTVVLDPGVTPRGVVADRLGRPVRAALVRSAECARGPARLTDADGRFRLPAVPQGTDLWIRPWDQAADRVPSLHDVDLRYLLHVTLDPWGLVETPWTGARLRVRARVVGAGAPESVRAVEVLREADGAFQVLSLERPPVGGSPDELRGEIEVAPGRYRLLAASELGAAFEVETRQVEVAPGADADVDVVVRPPPRLRVQGDVPRDARVDLATRTEALEQLSGDAGERQVPLSSDVPAALHVRHAGVTFVVPVGPASGGWREAVVALPPPHRIRWPEGVRPEGARLLRGRHEQAVEEVEGGIETRAMGDLVLEVDLGGEGGVRRLALRLPSSPAVDMVVDPRTAPVAPPERVSTYRIVAPPGTKVATSFSVSGAYGAVTAEGALQGSIGARLTATIPGYVAKRILVTRVEEREIRWGAASLDLRVVDEQGSPTAARVLLDDEPYDLPAGTLSLAGLDAGPHRLLVAPQGEAGPAKELRLLLHDRETRTRKVVLTGG